MSKIPFYVINLASSSKRWELIQHSYEKLTLNLVRIEGLDGRLKNRDKWMNVDEAAFEGVTGRKILPGEYGCYRSHILALETFLESNEPFAVILEDDVVPDEQTDSRISSIIQEIDAFDVIKLVNHRSSGFILAKQTSEGDNIGRTLFGPQGSAAAYLVSRHGAQRLLKSISTMRLPWDVALEQYWAYDGNLMSSEDNVLTFTDERDNSHIAPDGYGCKTSLATSIKRIIPVAASHFNFFKYGSIGPTIYNGSASLHPDDQSYPMLTYLLAGALFLMMASALWFETDAYRFACLALAIPAFYNYFTKDFWRYGKPLIGWMGILCSVWAIYVLIRFLVDFYENGGTNTGSAEGIYLFPVLYSTLGYAMWRLCPRPFWIVIAFMVISFIVLAIYTDYQSIFSAARASFGNHNNPIHASGAAGFILIIAIYFKVYVMSSAEIPVIRRGILLFISVVTIILALLNILNLHSKGVWLALLITAPVIIFSLCLFRLRAEFKKHQVAAIFAVFGLSVFFVVFSSNELVRVGSSTFFTVKNLVFEVLSGNGLIMSVIGMIDTAGVPASQIGRLQLWADALSIWSSDLIFGTGIDWRELWTDREYSKNLNYNMFHNGFLELGVRYGYLGLFFFGSTFIWACRRVFLASKTGLINPLVNQGYLALLVYFFAINLSNSNIRLAIGESYMLTAAAFGFYCAFRLQGNSVERPKVMV